MLLRHVFQLVILSLVVLLSACAQSPINFESNPSYVASDTEHTALVKEVKNALSENKKESTILLIGNGFDAYSARISLLYMAEKTIDVQYHIWQSDRLGKIFFNGLVQAADRDVKVRILLDDMPINKTTESLLYAMDQHENIDVRLFNPFADRGFRITSYLISPRKINRRKHNKSLTVDNQFTIIGGRNVGDEYFSEHKNINFKDVDVVATGSIVKEIGVQFDLYWNSKVVYPVDAFDHNIATKKDLKDMTNALSVFVKNKKNSKYKMDVKNSDMYKSLNRGELPEKNESFVFSGEVHVVYDDSLKVLDNAGVEVVYLKSLVSEHVAQVDKSFEIISSYFVPGNEGVAYLTALVKKGVKVKVITNSLSSTDGLLSQSGYSRRRYALLEGGVELYEFKADVKTKVSKTPRGKRNIKSALHAKIYIFDREQVFIGSFNFDKRSANIKAEVGVIYDVPEMAKHLSEAVFDESLSDGAYHVKIADKEISSGAVEIDEGEVYWFEIKNNKKILYSSEPNTSFWKRFGQGFFSIMPVESQL